MTRLENWTPSTHIDTDLNFIMRSQIVNHGVVIHHEGNYQSEPEYSPRRYSVIEISSDGIFFIIGSIAYNKGYESTNPYEPLVKYGSEEWKDLLVVKFPGPVEEAVKWDGTINTIHNSSFGG